VNGWNLYIIPRFRDVSVLSVYHCIHIIYFMFKLVFCCACCFKIIAITFLVVQKLIIIIYMGSTMGSAFASDRLEFHKIC